MHTDEDIKRSSVVGFRESKIFVLDIMDQKTYLEGRTKEIEDIKKVATQIKELSSNMKVELQEQGKKVDLIDRNVDEVKINVKKAEFEIQECFKLYDEYISNLKSDTRKLAELKQNNLPAFCYTRDEINFSKRILRNQFVEVGFICKYILICVLQELNFLFSNFSSCLMYQII